MLERKMTKIVAAVPFTATGTTGTYKITESNGFIERMIIKVPTFTNVVTATIQILDDDGDVLFDSGAKAMGTNYPLATVYIPLMYNYTTNVILSGVPGGAGGTVRVKMYTLSA